MTSFFQPNAKVPFCVKHRIKLYKLKSTARTVATTDPAPASADMYSAASDPSSVPVVLSSVATSSSSVAGPAESPSSTLLQSTSAHNTDASLAQSTSGADAYVLVKDMIARSVATLNNPWLVVFPSEPNHTVLVLNLGGPLGSLVQWDCGVTTSDLRYRVTSIRSKLFTEAGQFTPRDVASEWENLLQRLLKLKSCDGIQNAAAYREIMERPAAQTYASYVIDASAEPAAATLRAKECALLVDGGVQHCGDCKRAEVQLQRLAEWSWKTEEEKKSMTESDSEVPFSEMTTDEIRQRFRNLRKQLDAATRKLKRKL